MASSNHLSNQPARSVALQRPLFWATGRAVVLAAAGASAGAGIMELWPLVRRAAPWAEWAGLLGWFAFWLAVVVGVVGHWLYVRGRPLPAVAFHDGFLELPASAEATRARRLAYAEILAVSLLRRVGILFVLIESRQRVFVYRQDAFVDADGPAQLFDELRRRIRALPDGEATIERMEARQILAERAKAARPWATQTLMGLIVVFFANQYLTGSLASPFGLVRFGACAPVLVRDGEFFRLVAAGFLHQHAVHLLLSVLALFVVGSSLERLGGWARALVIYLACALAAATASVAVAAPILWVGASGAVLGVLGALGVLHLRFRHELPVGFRRPARWWFFVLALGALLVLVAQPVQLVPHVAGFVAGGTLAWALVRQREDLVPFAPTALALKTAALSLSGVCVIGLGWAVAHAAHADLDDERRFVQSVMSTTPPDANDLNTVAWFWATDARTSDTELELAEQAAMRATTLEPTLDAYADTLATIAYRRGRYDEAVSRERTIAEKNPEPFYGAQLARFLATRLAHSGPSVGSGLKASWVRVRLDATGEKAERTVVIDVAPELTSGVTVYALVRWADELVGLLRVRLGPRPKRSYRWPVAGSALEDLVAQGVHFEVAFVQSEPGGEVKAGAADWQLSPSVAAVTKLP